MFKKAGLPAKKLSLNGPFVSISEQPTQAYQSPTNDIVDSLSSSLSSEDDESSSESTTTDETSDTGSSDSESSSESSDEEEEEENRRKAERRREPDSVVDQNDRASKKGELGYQEPHQWFGQETAEVMEDFGPMNFKLPGQANAAVIDDNDTANHQCFLPHHQRMVTSGVHIVTTSVGSEAMSRYVDECPGHRMQIGSLHRLCDIAEEMDYPLVKQRGPYGDGLVLHGAILKVERMITNEDDRVVHVVLEDHRTDRKYLLDDRFFDDWSFVRNVDLEKMKGPAKKQFFV